MKPFRSTLVAAAVTVFVTTGGYALAARRLPSSALSDPVTSTVIPRNGPGVERVEQAPARVRPSATFFARMKARFRQLRPAWQKDGIPLTGNEEALQSKSLLDQVYTDDFERRLRDKYRDTVRINENVALNPVRPASRYEMERYLNSRNELARWAMKEIGRDYLKAQLAKTDSSVVNAVRGGGNTPAEEYQREVEHQRMLDARGQHLSERERRDRFHRIGYLEEEEEEIPTKVRTKLNPLKGQGQITLQSSAVTASVEASARSQDALAVEVRKEFKKAELTSRARYNVDQSLVTVNVSKRLTPEIAVDLASERWMGEDRSENGEKRRESARVTYTLAF